MDAGRGRRAALFSIALLCLGFASSFMSSDSSRFPKGDRVMLRIPFADPGLEVSQQGLAIASFLVSAVSLVAVFALSTHARRIGLGVVARLRNAGPDRTRTRVALLAPLLVAGVAFLPVRSQDTKLTLYYGLTLPGFLALFLALWPSASSWLRNAAPRLVSFFFETGERAFVIAGFFGTFVLTNLAAFFVFDHRPHVVTGIAHLFHARIFAEGKLYLASHPLKEFFDIGVIINDGRWYSQFPPGHTILLTLGELLGASWIINPLAGSLCVPVFYYLGKEIYDERTGRLAALFGALSPWLILMSGEFYNHASALLFISLFILFFAKMVNAPSYGPALLAGAFLGFAMLCRPISAAAGAFPFGLYSLWLLFRERQRYLAPLVAMGVALALFVAIQLGFNALTTGDALASGYHALGNVDRWASGNVGTGFANVVGRLGLLNKSLFEWPIPSALFVVILFMSATRNKWDYLLLSVLFSGLAWYFVWYYHAYWDGRFGPRYLYYSIGVLAVLSARGLLRTPELVNRVLQLGTPPATARRAAGVALGLCFVLALTMNLVPKLRSFSPESWKRWRVDRYVQDIVAERGIENAIVFTRSAIGATLYRTVFLSNPLNPDEADIVYAKDLGAANRALLEYYPDRAAFLASQRPDRSCCELERLR